MDLRLENKTALITGGASGIGLETARYLVRDGVKIALADLYEDQIHEATAELEAMGGTAIGIPTDVRDYEACEHMTRVAQEKLGSIDILVASAGVGGGRKFFVESEPGDWERMIDVNFRGMLNTNRAVAPVMVEQGGGSIVNIASEAGKVGEKRIVVYAATKGGVISFSKAFAVEMGRFKVRVNAVCPGVTRTPMTKEKFGDPGDATYEAAAKFYPLGRLGEPEDVASMVAFLASDQSGWITGQAISVNGGFGRS